MLVSAVWPQSVSMTHCGWIPMRGVKTGIITGVAAGDGVLMVSTQFRNLFRSGDSGKTWLPFPVPLRPQAFWDGMRSSMVYYDPAGKSFYGLGDSGIYAAAPRDSAWRKIDTGHAVLISAHGPNLILSPQLNSGARVSRDGGRTWKTSVYPQVGLNILGVLATDSCVYASDMDSPVSVSCDGGATWKHTGGDSLSNYTYAMVPIPGGIIAAAALGLIRTLDRGKSWSPWVGNLPGENRISELRQSGNSLFASDQSRSFYRSVDNGLTWASLPSPSSKPTYPFALAELGERVYAGTLYGLRYTRDGGVQWNLLNENEYPMDTPILSVGISKKNHLALTSMGLFISRDSADTWTPLFSPSNNDGVTCTALAGSGSFFAAALNLGRIRISNDGGTVWSATGSIPGGNPVTDLAIAGPSIFALTPDGAWRMGIQGGEWSALKLPVQDQPRILAGGTSSLFIGGNAGLWEVLGDGTVIDRKGNLPPSQVQKIFAVENRPYLVSADGYAYLWDEAGSGWKQMPNLAGTCFSIAGSGNEMVAATSQGLWVSQNAGSTWRGMVPANLQDDQIHSLILSEGSVYGAGAGIWKMSWQFPGAAVGISKASGRKGKIRGKADYSHILAGRNRLVNGRLAKP